MKLPDEALVKLSNIKKNYNVIISADIFESFNIYTSVGSIKVLGYMYFYEASGDIFCIGLCEPQEVNTLAGKFKVKWISFFPDGRLDKIILSEPEEVNTRSGKLKVQEISFDDDGPVGVTLSEPQEVNTDRGKLKLDGKIRFDINGSIIKNK